MGNFHQLKGTNKVAEEGKWFLIYKRKQYDEAVECMDKVLSKLYNQIKPEHILEGYDYPMQVQSKAVRTQSFYADVLKNKYATANPQEETTKYDQPPSRERKRQAIT
eukprot:2478324-Ditylum_brightwellii.AAC.1